ncbi:MAG: hypothetical protein GY794_01195 [bacterium]|nr:hypothetical protein [bacterium]
MAAADDNYKFPLLWTTGQPEASIKPTGAAPDLEKLKTKLIGREAAMQNMWILLAKEYTVELAFMCPEDNDWVPRVLADNADRDVGWHSSKNFSYGLHFPYRTTTVDGKTVANPAHLDKGILLIDGSFAIMADKNPLNHGDLVRVNALRLSGAIEYLRGESDFEINNDNIYTIQTQNNANLSTPANINDQYIIRHP